MNSRNKKMDFSSKIKSQVDEHKEEGQKSYGYLNLPNDLTVYSIDIPKKLDSLKVKFDIIPYIVKDEKHPDIKVGASVGEPWWRRPVLVHRNIGVDDESVICLQTIGKKCPICEYKKELIKDKAAKEDIKALNYSKRSIYLVWPKEDKDFDEELHVFDISDFCFYDPLMIDVEELNEFNFPSLEDGKTLQVRFNKEIFAGNEFSKAIRVSFFKRDEQFESSMLDETPCLDDILNILSYDELSAKFFETGDEKEDNEKPKKGAVKDDEDAPRQSKSTRAPKSTSKKTEPEITWEQLEIKSNRSLVRLITEEKLEINPDDFDSEMELRIAIAQELKIEVPEPKSKTPKQNSKPSNDDINWEVLNEMSLRRLTRLCEDEKLEVLPSDFNADSLDDFKKEIATEMGIEMPKPAKKEKAKAGTSRKSETGKSKSENECPSGYIFGVDTDKYPECETCTVWNPCLDKKESK